jgi:hypothetical protein
MNCEGSRTRGTGSSNPSPSSEESCELRCRRRNRARGAASDPIATHIAARGIDVDGVSPVINFDLPNETSATLVIPGVQNRRQHQRQPLSAVIRLSSAERSLRALLIASRIPRPVTPRCPLWRRRPSLLLRGREPCVRVRGGWLIQDRHTQSGDLC